MMSDTTNVLSFNKGAFWMASFLMFAPAEVASTQQAIQDQKLYPIESYNGINTDDVDIISSNVVQHDEDDFLDIEYSVTPISVSEPIKTRVISDECGVLSISEDLFEEFDYDD